VTKTLMLIVFKRYLSFVALDKLENLMGSVLMRIAVIKSVMGKMVLL